ncbi:MAG TPA: hypothetical protein VFQ53_10405 [Kofleriaceae bacterium]|nr:hypothetical protein [Kofleriaceae bacterium]
MTTKRAKTQRPRAKSKAGAAKRRPGSSLVATAPFEKPAFAADDEEIADVLDALETKSPERAAADEQAAVAAIAAIDDSDAVEIPLDAVEVIEELDDVIVAEHTPERRDPSRPQVTWDARAISVGESVADDQVLAVDELSDLSELAVAVYDEAPELVLAQPAIRDTGHTVVAVASGRDGIGKLDRALREGSVDVLVVGLPGGEVMLDHARTLGTQRPVTIAAVSGSPIEAVERAADAGADLAVTRPYAAHALAPILLAAARLASERRASSSAKGSEAVLRARLDALVETEPGALQPFELFQRVLELELKRARRYAYPIAVALFAVEIPPPPPPVGIRGILRARAGTALIHSIRDIDLATELDHERFLVLLPYTHLAGAATVARRIIAAVAGGDAVTAAGRVFPPRLVGAVAGALPGQPLSFSRLMRDATRALERARRDGAELASPLVEDEP